MLFNINDTVRVKLTDEGREIHKQYMQGLFAGWGYEREYKPKSEDKDGWSSWQLWELMQLFGPHISLGCMVPFETNIKIGGE